VSSAVVDLGSFETRAGYSGEDCPRSVIPSVAGVIAEGTEDAKKDEDVEMRGAAKPQLVTGSNLTFKRDHMAIKPLFQTDTTIDFDILEDILQTSLSSNLMLAIKETPLLFTENSIHNKDMRLKLTEFLFEKFKVPALFLCKDAVLSSFACGRSSAIVLDSGCSKTTATPVHDGYALQKCILRCSIGGETITDRLE